MTFLTADVPQVVQLSAPKNFGADLFFAFSVCSPSFLLQFPTLGPVFGDLPCTSYFTRGGLSKPTDQPPPGAWENFDSLPILVFQISPFRQNLLRLPASRSPLSPEAEVEEGGREEIRSIPIIWCSSRTRAHAADSRRDRPFSAAHHVVSRNESEVEFK